MRSAEQTSSHATRQVLAGGALMVAIFAGGCGWLHETPTSPGPITSAAPVATASSLPPVIPTGSPSAASPWGPLAVVPPQAGADTARTEGTLRVTNRCVFLTTSGGPVVLLWPADVTAWDAGTRTITFANRDGDTSSVADGSPVVLGGSGDSNEESGTTTEDWLARTTWVVRPDDSCPLDERWWVGALMLNPFGPAEGR